MSSDPLAPAPFVQAAAASKPKKPDITLGVFSCGGAWKLYSASDRASTYPTRREAMIAAEDRAFAETRAGRKVELFVEDENGGLGQADIGVH